MASKSRLEGAVRLARAYVDSSNSTFVERELAWAVLRLAQGQKGEMGAAATPASTGAERPDLGEGAGV